ncbi:Uncharacterised protein [Segatella copri]|nr:Uncharacterised protein [Segatella copri]
MIISLRNALARKSIRCNNIGTSLQVATVNIRYHIRNYTSESQYPWHHRESEFSPLQSLLNSSLSKSA